MSLIPQTLEQLLRLGASVELTENQKYTSQTLENLARIAVASGGHITMTVGNYTPQTLENLARIAKNHITFRI